MKKLKKIFNENGHAVLEASMILGFVAVAAVVALYMFGAGGEAQAAVSLIL